MSESESLIGIEECSICRELLESNLKTTDCQHTFHRACIDRWLEEHNTCPVCRTELFDVHLINHQNYHFSCGRLRLCPVTQNQRFRNMKLLIYSSFLVLVLWLVYNVISHMTIVDYFSWIYLSLLTLLFIWDLYNVLCLLFNCRLYNCRIRRVEMTDDFDPMEII